MRNFLIFSCLTALCLAILALSGISLAGWALDFRVGEFLQWRSWSSPVVFLTAGIVCLSGIAGLLASSALGLLGWLIRPKSAKRGSTSRPQSRRKTTV